MSDTTTQVDKYQELKGKKPCFHDGYFSRKSYLIIAAKKAENSDKYNCIGIREVGGYYRVHAYPNFDFFGLETPSEAYHRASDLNGKSYQGAHLTQREITAILNVLANNRSVIAADPDSAFFEEDMGYHSERAIAAPQSARQAS